MFTRRAVSVSPLLSLLVLAAPTPSFLFMPPLYQHLFPYRRLPSALLSLPPACTASGIYHALQGPGEEEGGEANQRDRAGVFKLFYNDIYKFPLPEAHRFPVRLVVPACAAVTLSAACAEVGCLLPGVQMGKYKIVRERIQNDATAARHTELEPSPLARSADLRTTHCPGVRACAPARLCLCARARAHACLTSHEIAAAEYIKRFMCNMLTVRENRNIGFPWSPEGVKRALSSVGGTVAAAHAVCGGPYLFSGHVAGGTHHAFYDYGEGFCVFSDIAVAANTMMRDYPNVQRILIIDLDVHQGVCACVRVCV
jgi:hypothetical protein